MSPEFSLPEFLSWCRTKPADEAYDFCDPNVCAIGQFGHATGRTGLTNLGCRTLDELGLLDVVQGEWRSEQTFGALVKRLEKLCPETPDYARIEAYLADIEAVSA